MSSSILASTTFRALEDAAFGCTFARAGFVLALVFGFEPGPALAALGGGPLCETNTRVRTRTQCIIHVALRSLRALKGHINQSSKLTV